MKLRRNPSRSRPILRNPEGIRLTRGEVLIPGERVYKAKLIGKGMFAKAYHLQGRKPSILIAINDSSQDYAKELVAMAYEDSGGNPYIPRIRKLGWNATQTFYEMPLYNAPLKKSASPKAWNQYLAIRKCWKEAEAETVSYSAKRRIARKHLGYQIMQGTVDKARKHKGIPSKLVQALEALQHTAANYGADYSFEFSPRNLATTARGRLILLDSVFSQEAVGRVLQSRHKRTRGW